MRHFFFGVLVAALASLGAALFTVLVFAFVVGAFDAVFFFAAIFNLRSGSMHSASTTVQRTRPS